MSSPKKISALTSQALIFSLDCGECDYSLKRDHVDDGGLLEVSVPARRGLDDGYKFVVFTFDRDGRFLSVHAEAPA